MALAMLLIAMALSRLLSIEDYATFRQTLLTYQFAAPLLGLGLPAAILYFLPKSPENGRATVAEALLLNAFSGLLFAAFFLFGGSALLADVFNNPALESSLRWFACFPLLFLPTQLVSPVLVAQQRAPVLAGFSLGVALIRSFAVILPVLWLASSPTMAVWGLLAGAGIVLIPALFFLFRWTPGRLRIVQMRHMRHMLAYSVPLSVGAVVGTLNKNIDKVFVSALEEPEVFAVFVNGAMEIPFIAIITGSAASVMIPDLTRYYQEGRFAEAIDLFKRSAVKCGTILIPIGGFLFLLAPELMVALYGPDYAGAALYFRLYLLLLPFRAVLYGALFQAAGRTDLVLIRALISLVLNGVVTLSLVILFGPVGAVLGTLAVTAFFAVPYCLVTCRKLYEVSVVDILPYALLLKMLLLCCAAYFFAILLVSLSGPTQFYAMTIKAVAFILIYLLAIRAYSVSNLPFLKYLQQKVF
jgi:O-antigen/teichoic acid export membrane protein